MPSPATIPRLYAIADVEVLGAGKVPRAVETMAACGIEWIQIRAKSISGAELCWLVETCLRELQDSSVSLWIDDRADIAAFFPDIAGLHVGQLDLAPAAVRCVVGDRCLIGQSTHDLDQLAAAAADPDVDVIALGPIFPTRSKRRPDPVVGLEKLQQARQLTDKPLVAIGGIDDQRARQTLAAGADTVAVLGALCRGDLRRNCARLQEAVGASSAERMAAG